MLSFFVIAMDMFVKTLTSWEEPLFFPFVIADNLILLSIFSSTSKCMHGMNQTEAEYSRHGKRSQRASLSQIGPVVLEE